MTNPQYTHIKLVVDRSGSMGNPGEFEHTIAWNMVSAIKEFFKKQATVNGKCLIDYVMFDTSYELVYQNVNVAEAHAVLEPRGLTALLDAIGKATVELGEKLAGIEEDDRPSKVMVVVVTDGHENASHEWTVESVKELVTQQQEVYNWDYVFLGANMDAIAVAADMGFLSGKSLTFDTQKTGVATAALGNYTTQYRTTGSAEFRDQDRKANA